MSELDVVCLSHLRWDFVRQRPQHLMSRCARERRVFYFEEPVADAEEPWLDVSERAGGVRVCTPHVPGGLDLEDTEAVQRTLLDELFVQEEIADYLLWIYTPMAVAYAEHLRPRVTVYDCMDELSLFAHAPAELRDREARLLRKADVVFTGGPSLFEAKRALHANVHLFPSSVDREHFERARAPLPEPPDQAPIPRPRLGFFGVVDERLDLALVAELADARPEWQLVFIGPVTKIDPAALPQRPNVHWLGAKAYDELPAYVAGWSVALMPFACNEATRFISPTKTLEYLAAGRPVVSTPIRDVVRPYGEGGLVAIAEDAAGFVDAVERALACPAAALDLAAVETLLESTSWDATWARMERLLFDAAERRARRRRPQSFDFLVVGAGFAGSVLAERLASQLGQRVLVVDRRPHVGGNAYDHYDDAGVLVHRYGPHIFHTNSAEVFAYLSHFTEWRPYEHRVLASVDGRLVPFPINLDTVNELYGLELSSLELDAFFESVAEPRAPVRTLEDAVVAKVGRELYQKFFRNYTRKQWDLDPSELDAAVAARVPARTSRDARYFTDTYQAMPRHGYTRLFERLLAHPNVKVLLNADFREIMDVIPHERLVYTGPIDEFFDHRYGKLPYRSLEFRFETIDAEVAQPAAVVNYPNEHEYTRVTEFKYLTGQEHPRTTLVYEYPKAEGDPYYPVPRPENQELYKEYKALADALPRTTFAGRLATYRYYNMDQVVAQALCAFRRLCDGDDRSEPSATGAVGRSRVHGRARR